MSKEDNECDWDEGNTYTEVRYELESSIVDSKVAEELSELIDEYNKSNGF